MREVVQLRIDSAGASHFNGRRRQIERMDFVFTGKKPEIGTVAAPDRKDLQTSFGKSVDYLSIRNANCQVSCGICRGIDGFSLRLLFLHPNPIKSVNA